MVYIQYFCFFQGHISVWSIFNISVFSKDIFLYGLYSIFLFFPRTYFCMVYIQYFCFFQGHISVWSIFNISATFQQPRTYFCMVYIQYFRYFLAAKDIFLYGLYSIFQLLSSSQGHISVWSIFNIYATFQQPRTYFCMVYIQYFSYFLAAKDIFLYGLYSIFQLLSSSQGHVSVWSIFNISATFQQPRTYFCMVYIQYFSYFLAAKDIFLYGLYSIFPLLSSSQGHISVWSIFNISAIFQQPRTYFCMVYIQYLCYFLAAKDIFLYGLYSIFPLLSSRQGHISVWSIFNISATFQQPRTYFCMVYIQYFRYFLAAKDIFLYGLYSIFPLLSSSQGHISVWSIFNISATFQPPRTYFCMVYI